MRKLDFWVVIPAYNEEKLIAGTLRALANQTDQDFRVVVVDNASTDNTAAIVKDFANTAQFDLHLLSESQKGTGAASDTGFRYAIKQGAKIVARTDADALPSTQWVELFKLDFEQGKRFVGGRLAPRTDEHNYRWFDGIFIKYMIMLVEQAPGIFYRRPGQQYRMFMVPGLNMAIDARLYEEVGGFPRSSIDDTDEDLELHLKVCQTIPKSQVSLNKKAIVYGSIRKAKAMGYVGILLWYWDRKHRPTEIDIR